MSYEPNVYHKQGGDEFVVASGGTLTIEAGGTIANAGAMTDSVVTKSANYTLTAADSGKVIVVTGADKVMTLLATVAGLRFRFVLAATALSTGTGLSISPQSTDKIMGNGFTSEDDKDAILAGSGDREGDMIEVVGDGDLGWYITGVTGTWTRET